MRYLSIEESKRISFQVEVRPFSEGYRIKDFSSGIPVYNRFLKNEAKIYSQLGISQTHLLINKSNGDVIGYITLCNDAIELSDEEKYDDGMSEIRFIAIPALKIGQLAVAKKYRETGIHYGSFLIEIAEAMVYKLNDMGCACRYLTLDADVENKDDKGRDVTYFYIKNGFKVNKHAEYEDKKTVSMRYDVFANNESDDMVAMTQG